MRISMIFLDTNVFLYAAGGPHRYRDPCQSVLLRLRENSLIATTNTEVIQELLYVLRRKNREKQALELARDVIALLPDLLPVTRVDAALACDLLEQHPDLPTRDAVHVATMRSNGLDTLISADQHFDAVTGVRRIDPADVS